MTPIAPSTKESIAGILREWLWARSHAEGEGRDSTVRLEIMGIDEASERLAALQSRAERPTEEEIVEAAEAGFTAAQKWAGEDYTQTTFADPDIRNAYVAITRAILALLLPSAAKREDIVPSNDGQAGAGTPCPECDGTGTAWGSLCGYCGGTVRI